MVSEIKLDDNPKIHKLSGDNALQLYEIISSFLSFNKSGPGLTSLHEYGIGNWITQNR